jgi:hypothetical protein
MVYDLSRSIFDNQSTPNEHPSLDEWFSRFDERKGIILVACDATHSSMSSPYEELCREKLFSYTFAYESKSVLNENMCMHIWLSATDPSHRGRGLTRWVNIDVLSLFRLVMICFSTTELTVSCSHDFITTGSCFHK